MAEIEPTTLDPYSQSGAYGFSAKATPPLSASSLIPVCPIKFANYELIELRSTNLSNNPNLT